jgi:asparagine synthetase B (glutamine-hydrolysing)
MGSNRGTGAEVARMPVALGHRGPRWHVAAVSWAAMLESTRSPASDAHEIECAKNHSTAI